MPTALPFRQVHLDFHTGPGIPDVGRDFDARAFARTLKQAHVNSVTVFAKCHHGHLYYKTKHPARHPGLKPGLDLLAQQVEALHREGIRAPVYLSVQCDEYAANAHPEWICRKPDGSLVTAKPLQAIYPHYSWQILDMSSDYQDYLAEQTAEVLKLFKPVDGLFFDMCWDQETVSHAALRAMARKNLNPELEADRKRHAHEVAIAYMKRFHRQVKASAPEASVYFNSRPLAGLPEEIPYLGQVEIEALPTGGWGYLYFPKNVRFARTFPRPYIGMTARFHKGWADFGGLKPAAALEYETAQMLAHGAGCSIGDQLHPRGVLDRATYDLIGGAYARVAAREPWCQGAKAQVDIGLFQVPVDTSSVQASVSGSDEGATRLLTQLKQQFDVVHAGSDLSRYRLLILPDFVKLDAAKARELSAYVRAGGSLLCTGFSGLSPDGSQVLLKELGLKAHGPSPFLATYFRMARGFGAGIAAADHVMYERGVRVVPAGATTVAGVVDPYFDRAWNHFSSHMQTPGEKLSRYAAATIKGRVGYIAYPLFAAYAQHGNAPFRQLLAALLDRLLPDPLLRVQAPTSTEATVMRQEKERRTIVHLLQYCPERRANGMDLVEDVVPIREVGLSLRLAKAPKRVSLAPEGEALPFTYADGRCRVTVPEVRGHAMVVFA